MGLKYRQRTGRSRGRRFETLEQRHLLAANFQISEFMASNDDTIDDEDGNDSDWIEITNAGDATGSLDGWYLTDDADRLTKWRFPNVGVPPGEQLLVWASDKDRNDPAAPLHTNFKLKSGGEYLALVKPDGQTVVSEYAPAYPRQFTDISYGTPTSTSTTNFSLVASSSPVTANVPNGSDTNLDWTMPGFDDSTWESGNGGVGYDTNPDYDPLIGLDVESAMRGVNRSVYVRYPFTATSTGFTELTLTMQYDDGFVAYFNGREIARGNAPSSLAWNSGAASDRVDSEAVRPVVIDVTDAAQWLRPGENVLAIHGLNVVIGSSGMLITATLDGTIVEEAVLPGQRYFSVPSPGESNAASSLDASPIFFDVSQPAAALAEDEPLVVTAEVRESASAVSEVSLRYRVMYEDEIAIMMVDDGSGDDAQTGDGIYTATIPGGVAAPGEMLRYYVSAAAQSGDTTRFPRYADPNGSAEYLGIVVEDSTVSSQLPIYQWFTPNRNWFRNGDGTNNRNEAPASLYYDGKFYDNIHVRTRGVTSRNNFAPKFKFKFNSGEPFQFSADELPVKAFNLESSWLDPSYARLALGFEIFREIGAKGSLAFPVHTRMNGEFYRLSVFVERVDETFLERNGFGSEGAVYNAKGVLDSNFSLLPGADLSTTAGMKKTNREWEPGFSDLQELINGVSPSNPNRATYILDNVDLPQIFNVLSGYALTRQFDRNAHNYMMVRDSDGTGLWSMIPWDLDTIFDRLREPLYGTIYFRGHPLDGSSSLPSWGPAYWNRLIDAIVDIPVLREMYVRRLRNLMDEYLQLPGTTQEESVLSQRVDEMQAKVAQEAILDYDIWGLKSSSAWTNPGPFPAGAAALHESIKDRRSYLYARSSIPEAQPEGAVVRFGAIGAYPASGNQDEEYIELINDNDFAIDISLWSLGDEVTHVFAPGTVIPSNSSLYATPDLNDFRTRTTGPRGGQGLVVQGDYRGNLAGEGGTITLADADGVFVDSLTYDRVPELVPLAYDDRFVATVDQSLAVDSAAGTLSNDEAALELTAWLIADVQHGTLTLSEDGSFTYTPEPGFIGTDSFRYVARDSIGDSNEAVAEILVTATGRALALSTRAGILENIPVLVRVDLLNQNGQPDHDVWDATVTLSADRPDIVLSTDQVRLLNGRGSALVSFSTDRLGPETLVPAGATWSYLDDGTNQGLPGDGASWFGDPNYDESSTGPGGQWRSGPAPLGYGDGDEATVIDFGGNSSDKYVTSYFRRSFDLPALLPYESLTVRLVRDDGAAVYLNGVEIIRDNLSAAASYTQLASSSATGSSENAFRTFSIDPGLLIEGTNTLAVEVHQAQPNSTDVSFDLELVAIPKLGDFTLTAVMGDEIASRSVVSLEESAVQHVSGILSGAATWSGVLHVTGDVIVPEGSSLTIAPGTLVLLDGTATPGATDGVDIEIAGSLFSLGTAARPVTFTAANPEAAWGELRHVGGSNSVYQYTNITRAGHSLPGDGTGVGAAVQIIDSTVRFDRVNITDVEGNVIRSVGNGGESEIVATQSLFSRAPVGVSLEDTQWLFDGGHITEILSQYDEVSNAIDRDGIVVVSREFNQEIVLRNSVVALGGGDGLVSTGADVLIESSIFRDWGASGISVTGGNSSIQESFLVDNQFGVVASAQTSSEGASLAINRSDIVGNAVGILREDTGAAVLEISITNSIVLAGNDSIDTSGQSQSFVVTYSLLGETWPGDGNLTGAPEFVDGPGHDYRLTPGSPAVDAGDPASDLDADGSRGDIGAIPFDGVRSAVGIAALTLLGSNWSEAMLGQLASDGLGVGGYSVLPRTDTDPPLLPWSTIDQIRITFTGDVLVDQAGLLATGITISQYDTEIGFVPDSFVFDAEARTATWTLNQVVSADRLTLSLSESVTDLFGQPLDGEVELTLPSGDGTPGGNFVMRLDVLPSDTNRSGSVDRADVVASLDRLFTRAGENGYDVYYDIDADGVIGLSDAARMAGRFGSSLPAAAPSAAASSAVLAAATELPDKMVPLRIQTGNRSHPRANAKLSVSVVDRLYNDSMPDRLTLYASRRPSTKLNSRTLRLNRTANE